MDLLQRYKTKKKKFVWMLLMFVVGIWLMIEGTVKTDFGRIILGYLVMMQMCIEIDFDKIKEKLGID